MYDTLLAWKNSEKKECLLVKGARQVGKTYLIRKFGEKE
jgi:predicted AAA+ superfamily ATPase